MVTKIFKAQGDIYRLFISQRHFQEYVQFHLYILFCLLGDVTELYSDL